MLTNRKSHAGRAVVSAGAVVRNTAAELREHEQRDVIAGLVVPQVVEEGFDGLRHIRPELRMRRGLVGMGVEPVVGGGGVQDARAEVGQVRLGNVLHVLPNRGVGVRHFRRVLRRRRGQNVSPLQGVSTGATDIAQRVVAANRRAIHLGEDVQGLHSLVLALDAGQQAVGVQVPYGGDRHAIFRQRPGQAAPIVDPSQHVLCPWVDFLNGLAQPALGADLDRLAGVPDVHGAEVGVAGMRVPNAQEDGQLARVPELFQGRHGWIETQRIVEGDDLVRWDTQMGSVVPIQAVGIRDHRIQTVIAT